MPTSSGGFDSWPRPSWTSLSSDFAMVPARTTLQDDGEVPDASAMVNIVREGEGEVGKILVNRRELGEQVPALSINFFLPRDRRWYEEDPRVVYAMVWYDRSYLSQPDSNML